MRTLHRVHIKKKDTKNGNKNLLHVPRIKTDFRSRAFSSSKFEHLPETHYLLCLAKSVCTLNINETVSLRMWQQPQCKNVAPDKISSKKTVILRFHFRGTPAWNNSEKNVENNNKCACYCCPVACIEDVRYAGTLFPLDTSEYSSPTLVEVETRALADNCGSTACGNIAPCPDGQYCYDMWRATECKYVGYLSSLLQHFSYFFLHFPLPSSLISSKRSVVIAYCSIYLYLFHSFYLNLLLHIIDFIFATLTHSEQCYRPNHYSFYLYLLLLL